MTLIVPGESTPGNPDTLLGPNSKTDTELAAMLKPLDGPVNPDLDLWNLVGQLNQDGVLPDKTAPDYVARNSSGDLVNTGLLTLINLIVFAPAGLILLAQKDRVTGVIVGWNLKPYEGNEWTEVDVKKARAAVEQRWPGMERMLAEHHQLGSKVNILPVEMADPEAGPTQEELDRARGIAVTSSGIEKTRKVEVDVMGNPTSFEETAVDGEYLLCVDCQIVPIVGNLADFEPLDVSEGGGFLCPTCHQVRLEAEKAASKAEYDRRIAIANPGLM